MTRTQKYKKLREQLKLESLVIQSTYIKAQSDELLNHTTQFKKYIQKEYHTDLPKVYVGDINIQHGQTGYRNDGSNWWKDYQITEVIKPK